MEQQYINGSLRSRALFDTLTDLNYFDNCSDFSQFLINKAREFYDNDPDATCVDLEILAETIKRDVPNKADLFISHLKAVPKVEDMSIPNLTKDAVGAKVHLLQEQLGNACYAQNREEIDRLICEIGELRENKNNNAEEDEHQLFHNVDPYSIRANTSSDSKLRIYPLALNELLGGALPGHHILVYARPDVGKTTFCINMTRGFLKDGHTVLYAANEEPPAAILQRLIQSMHAWTTQQFLTKDLDWEALQNAGYGNFHLYHSDSISLHKLEQLTSELNPDVVFVDQLRNIEIGSKGKDANKTLLLEEAARGVRKLGLRHDCLTVSVTQAGDSATNKLALDLGDVDFSNTGIPGAVDLMIGIGANDQWVEQGKRMVSTPKNKLSEHIKPLPLHFNTSIVRVK